MFSRATPNRLRLALGNAAEALLEVADAMLAPETLLGEPEHVGGAASLDTDHGTMLARPHVGELVPDRYEPAPAHAATSSTPHPHRRPLRSERNRRPGRPPAREQHCISPVTRTSSSATQPTSRPTDTPTHS